MKLWSMLLLAVALTACNSAKTEPVNTTPSKPVTTTETSTKPKKITTSGECATEGGIWRRAGRAGIYQCELRMSDAGKSCTDSTQCQSSCVAVDGATRGSKGTGQCYSSNIIFGCRAYVSNGIVGATLCID